MSFYVEDQTPFLTRANSAGKKSRLKVWRGNEILFSSRRFREPRSQCDRVSCPSFREREEELETLGPGGENELRDPVLSP